MILFDAASSTVDALNAAAAGGGIQVDNPLVLGPLAAFVFAIFVSEIVVSGRAYKREVAENARLRATVEKVVPLAEKMVATTEQIIEVTALATQALRDIEQATSFRSKDGGDKATKSHRVW